MRKKCPFQCGGELAPLKGSEGAKLLMNLLVAPNSALRGMLEGAANRHGDGQVQQCDTCDFVAIFPRRR